jgi:hypothetical protein
VDITPAKNGGAGAPPPTQEAGNRRFLLIGGIVLAFVLVIACAAAAFSIFRSGITPEPNTAALSVEEAPLPNSLSASAGANNESEEQDLPAVETIEVESITAANPTAVLTQEANPTTENQNEADPNPVPDFDPLFLTSYSYDGLIISLALPSNETERVLFSIDDPQPKIDNGRSTAGQLTIANNSIGPIPHAKGAHTLYVQYIDAAGNGSEIYNFEYEIDDIVLNFNQQPYDFETEGIPAIFTMFVVDGDTNALYSYAYSVDSKALDQSVDGVAEAGVIQLQKLEPGEHILYVQAESPSDQTGIVTFPFTIE